MKRTIIILTIIIFGIWFLGFVCFITIDGLTDNGQKADLAVVLGNKINLDGSLSERLQKRLECGLKLYKQQRVKKILVSGGLGREGFYEGDKMRDFLVNNGVPISSIIIDNDGNNTLATVKNTINLRDSLGFDSIIVVSQYFHLTRTKMLFKKNHFDNVNGVSPNYFEIRDLYSLFREFAAYYTE